MCLPDHNRDGFDYKPILSYFGMQAPTTGIVRSEPDTLPNMCLLNSTYHNQLLQT